MSPWCHILMAGPEEAFRDYLPPPPTHLKGCGFGKKEHIFHHLSFLSLKKNGRR